jgi:hypothetical protein
LVALELKVLQEQQVIQVQLVTRDLSELLALVELVELVVHLLLELLDLVVEQVELEEQVV